ncbi:hypothetical protein AVEN_77860-1 [Araneus ventricosus]|uniref:Helitron helicase-like domain-containing protein n=1 Tax=Araneus ventricosus TaxID=182803 RepID=A0A4Y2R0L3_ARAVE|nr:hypothetical protein AVEN_77860-1 [Araneus ventricosus]
MNLSRAVGYIIRNEQRRTERSQKTVQESTVRRSIRNEADNRRRPKRVCIRNDVEEHNCGTMSEQCGFCGAVYWKEEKNTAHKYTKCCHDGKVQLPAFPLTENSPDAKNYRQRIRECNSALAFAPMGAQIKPPRGTGPYCYRLHGQVYHRVSPPYASDQHKESYGQLYKFDSSEATEKRFSNNQNCLQHVFEKLDFMLREINPFAQSYLQMHRLVQEHPTTSVKMVFLEDKNLDMRRYNANTLCTEVAAIFVGDNGESPANRDICVYPVGDTCQSISPLNQCCDPMTYPLLFPRGECSWNTGMEHVEERRTAKLTRVLNNNIMHTHFPSEIVSVFCTIVTLPNCDKMHGTWPMWNYKYKFSMHERWTVPLSKRFPKQLRDDTEENVNGYPIYRRRATEPVHVGKYSIDNRWVVPYNTWLPKTFNAHNNVEVCASVKSIKFLYKYVYKGYYAASVKIQKEGALDHEEVLSFVEGRYVSTPEAMWRLNEFNLSHKSHTVVRLAVHLPHQQPIVYQDGQEAQAIERAALRKNNTNIMV